MTSSWVDSILSVQGLNRLSNHNTWWTMTSSVEFCLHQWPEGGLLHSPSRICSSWNGQSSAGLGSQHVLHLTGCHVSHWLTCRIHLQTLFAFSQTLEITTVQILSASCVRSFSGSACNIYAGWLFQSLFTGKPLSVEYGMNLFHIYGVFARPTSSRAAHEVWGTPTRAHLEDAAASLS